MKRAGVIDPFLTSQNGYFFETNPAGLMADALLSPAGQNRQWDGIWNEHVQRTDKGWTIEIEIPFSTLNFDPNNTSWGFNFQLTSRESHDQHRFCADGGRSASGELHPLLPVFSGKAHVFS